MTKLPSVTINGLQLSDMFFNSELIHWSDDATKENLMLDAIEFAKEFGGQVSPNELVEDFLARL
jgi:hypothetical protein